MKGAGRGVEKTAAEKERESRCARGRPRKEKGNRDGYINRTVRTCPVEFKEFTPASNNVPSRRVSRMDRADRLD